MWRLYYTMFVGLWIHKDHYKLIVVDLSRKEELDADPNAIQQIEFFGRLKKLDHNGHVIDGCVK